MSRGKEMMILEPGVFLKFILESDYSVVIISLTRENENCKRKVQSILIILH